MVFFCFLKYIWYSIWIHENYYLSYRELWLPTSPPFTHQCFSPYCACCHNKLVANNVAVLSFWFKSFSSVTICMVNFLNYSINSAISIFLTYSIMEVVHIAIKHTVYGLLLLHNALHTRNLCPLHSWSVLKWQNGFRMEATLGLHCIISRFGFCIILTSPLLFWKLLDVVSFHCFVNPLVLSPQCNCHSCCRSASDLRSQPSTFTVVDWDNGYDSFVDCYCQPRAIKLFYITAINDVRWCLQGICICWVWQPSVGQWSSR